MESISFNINRQRPNLRFYEFGNCYFLEEKSDNKDVLDKYKEEQHLSIFLTGNRSEGNWLEKNRSSSFYELKSHVESILLKAGIKDYDLRTPETARDFIHGGIAFMKEGNEIAYAGIVGENWLKFFDLKNQVFYADLNWEILKDMLSTKPVTFTELPRFPEVRRDLSMMLEKTITYEQIRQLAFQAEKKILKRMILFDVYEGDKIEKDKKSYAVSFILQDENRTLTDNLIEKTVNNLAAIFEKKLGALIRR